MTDEQKAQIAGEIENEGFEYWMQNFAQNSLIENNAPKYLLGLVKNAVYHLELAEEAFIREGLMVE